MRVEWAKTDIGGHFMSVRSKRVYQIKEVKNGRVYAEVISTPKKDRVPVGTKTNWSVFEFYWLVNLEKAPKKGWPHERTAP